QSDKDYGFSKNKNLNKIIDTLYENNINELDTAPAYKDSHKILSNIGKKKFNIYTKLPNITCDIRELETKTRETILKIFEKNKISQLEGILLHDPLMPLDKSRWNIIYKILNDFKKEKLIRNIGVSVYNTFELSNLLKNFTPDIIQFPYNIFNQEFNDEKLLKGLKKKGILLHARSIFLQGLLLQNRRNLNKYFLNWSNNFMSWQKYLKIHKKKPEQACIEFVLSNKYIDKVVIGVDNDLQFKENMKIFSKFKNKKNYPKIEFLKVDDERLTDPRLWKLNSKLDKSYHLWKAAKSNILGGGMLLSKKPDQFLPGKWPLYFKKAKGCHIWDSNNKKYLDFSLMGVGTNILGYANKNINKKIKDVISNSNISTLNSREDYLLSKKLISMHKWASMCFFARTGGEANAIAIRIARAYSKKEGIAICGYHGWHDWYLSANIKTKKNLDKVFLSGVETAGVPEKLSNLTHPFKYNDINALKKIIKKNRNIGTIFMEVQRNEIPRNNFLKKIRNIADKHKIILIFDECTSGFRETFGGLHNKYNVNPDIAVFGKSLGNGIPITAIIGKKYIMESGKKSFISSTFWTDRLGPSSALATLEEMSKLKSWKLISSTGKIIKKEWFRLSNKYNLGLKITGLDAMPMFNFQTGKNIYYKNFITQEMLKKNILATNTVYCSIDHKKYLSIYFNELEKIFSKIEKFENGANIISKLENPLSTSGISRLN
ncbi:aminotransferase class III-fold pyridoxal phosphate-dependent enzyme, partial [Candidatus Pelagibacter sp.]|nr:aminotransferase class III-fold pyridoxal phosphate-dependent enzyme [Candidatus Pelagibacter sp.]